MYFPNRNKHIETRYNLDKYVSLWKLITPYILGFCAVGLFFAGTVLVMAYKESIDAFSIPQPVIGWACVVLYAIGVFFWVRYWTKRHFGK